MNDGNPHDYFVHFNVPSLSVDGYGNAISFGTPGTDFITLSITSGNNDNFSYDIFAVGLYRGWGKSEWEHYDQRRDFIACQQEYAHVKVAYAGTTTSGANFGGCANAPDGFMGIPTVKMELIDYNSGGFTGEIVAITKTSGGQFPFFELSIRHPC